MDPSRIQRVVLLIDLYPLLDLQNPYSYLSPILSAARRILSFPPLASSLFAYKLFFSSFSPILSTSTVHRLLGKSSTFLSFDCPAPTLDSLSRTLDSLPSVSGSGHSAFDHGFSRASLLAKSLLQLEHDYGWEPHPQDRKGAQELLAIRSNLVVLFSPMRPGPNFLSDHVDLELGGESDSAMRSDAFLQRFLECFGLVKERLASCDIHLSWVDVNFDYHCERDVSGSEFFERGIRELGWGFCSTDAIVLGSALVPFGLVFPCIGCAMGFAADRRLNRGTSELVLEIVDVYGKPLECKSCELEVLDLKPVRERSDMMGSLLKVLGSKTSNIRIREVWRSDDGKKVMSDPSNLYLIGGITGECNKVSRNHAREFLADSILKLLCREKGEWVADKPLWQILLTFLYNKSYWASVSIYDSDDKSMEGVLIPFTVNYALLAVPQENSLNSCQVVARKSRSTSETLHSPVLAGSREDSRRKRKKLQLHQIQNATLSSFREFVLSQADDVALGAGLEQLYSGKIHDKSKKLMFLKCWMRQIVKSKTNCELLLDEQKEPLDIKEDVETRNIASQDASEAEAIPSSTEDAHQSASSANKDALIFSCMEDMETFLRSIPQKIEQGLCSLDTDFGNLAERLVGLSIRALDAQIGKNVEDIISDETGDASYVKIADEVSSLLLVKPRDLISKYKTTNPACIASSNPVSDIYSTEYKIREYSHSLKEVIDKIYNRMEFDLCDEDEVGASDSLPNSNSEGFDIGNRFPANPIEVAQQEKHARTQQEKLDNAHERRLMKAQERRNRDRRFSSFTSWVPDLQRVWALKQPKAERLMRSSLPNPLKRRRRHSSTDDRVCETPMMDRKLQSQSQEDACGGMNRSNPLSKALFHQ
ncbi:hypothetical protein B296_00052225 [Ensete ventricosum]|uniref:Treslin N-terminal domain-containing protein n=1 Tax=Ensete ventricosum TaxID=4639 RepID=A0A426YD53_ENSVE|nr:hypothetical protein B296_00052225 [Ensete ventricosum]